MIRVCGLPGIKWRMGSKVINNRGHRLLLKKSLEKNKEVGQYINMKIVLSISFVIAKIE